MNKEDFSDSKKWEDKGASAWKERLGNFIASSSRLFNNKLGLDTLANTWSQSTAKDGKVNVAGAVTVVDVHQSSDAYIADDAKVNQDVGLQHPIEKGERTVTVKAVNTDESVHFGGNIQFPGLQGSSWKFTINPQAPSGGTTGGDAAIGATVMILEHTNTVRAEIHDKAAVYADSLQVLADNRALAVTFTGSGGKSDKFAFNGVFTLIDFDNTTHARMASGARVEAGNKTIDNEDASVVVRAKDDSKIVNLSGGVAIGGAVGIGATVAINFIDRDTRAIIGKLELEDSDNSGKPTGNARTLKTSGNVKVAAENTGIIVTAAIAGAGASGKPSSTDPKDALESETGVKFGVGISANVAINKVNDDTLAYVHDAAVEAKNLSITANNPTDIWALGLAASVGFGTDVTVALSGTYGQNTLKLNTQSFADNSNIVLAGDFKQSAKNSGDLISRCDWCFTGGS